MTDHELSRQLDRVVFRLNVIIAILLLPVVLVGVSALLTGTTTGIVVFLVIAVFVGLLYHSYANRS